MKASSRLFRLGFISTLLVLTIGLSAQVAPVIDQQPNNANLLEGQNAFLAVGAGYDNTLTYQWQRLPTGSATWVNLTDGGAYFSTSTSNLYVNSVTQAMNGDQFRCIVTNGAGSSTSFPATLSVTPATAPVITNMPAGVNADTGGYCSIYPGVFGTQPMTFQWKKNGVVINGATDSYFSISNPTTAGSGQYTLTATNSSGSVTSSITVITINPPAAPVIYGLPAGVNPDTGGSLSLSPTVAGTQPITYQWKKNGVAINGATFYYFNASNLTTADNGQYTLTATNQQGSVTSTIVNVNVKSPVAPSITGLPVAFTVNYGDSLSFSPNVDGTQSMTVQWKKNGTAINGATSSYFYINSVTTTDSGQYTLTATNSVGSTTSSIVNVTVNPAVAPAIGGLPAIFTPNYGDNLSLSPYVSGTQPMTFQWKKDGVAITGATSLNYYSANTLTSADNGVYTLTATNSVGSTTSSPLTVTVNSPVVPTITGLPTKFNLDYGTNLAFYPSVYGTQPMTFQWKKDGVAITGATSATYYSPSAVTLADSGHYTLTATNSVGSTTSSPLTVTVNSPVVPTITGLPTKFNLDYGTNLAFYPSVYGTQPMTFQWKKDGVAITGATSATYYSPSAVTLADSGHYTLTATNSVGSTTSSPVTITVNPAVAPSIDGLPPTSTVNYGEDLALYPTVTGTQPMTFQWKKNGSAINGATTSNFYGYNLTTADSGQYTLTATNQVGATTSSTVTVTVNPAAAPALAGMPATLTLDYGTSVSFGPTVSGTQPMTSNGRRTASPSLG